VGSLMVASLALLIILQSTNLWKEFAIESSSDLVLLYALSSLNFAAFVIFAFIFARSIIKLVRERRTFQLGAQIKTRLLLYFFAVTLLPIIAMAVFSYLFMNRALERWFTQIPENVIREAREVQGQSMVDRVEKLDAAAKMIAASLDGKSVTQPDLQRIAEAGRLVHITLLSQEGRILANADGEVPSDQVQELSKAVEAGRSGNPIDGSLRDGRGIEVAVARLSDGRSLVIVPDPLVERSVSKIVENSVSEFERLKQKQVVIRQVGLLTLGMLTFLLIFASTWVAFYVARGITLPIKALAEGADEVARGNLEHRVEVLAEDELDLLVGAFNQMTGRLQANSVELSERRRYIETVLDTLPTGIISFDANNNISTINRTAADILQLEPSGIDRISLANLRYPETAAKLSTIVGRARRAGKASDQVNIPAAPNDEQYKDELTISLSATKLPSDGGVVLVLEDLSELISAQRSAAWQEVAQRMAHEIKNPLTPIQLSAERIAKRFAGMIAPANGGGKRSSDGAQGIDIIHESTNTILREVTSLKTMVDEFSKFARLPDTKLIRGDLNFVIRQAAAVFSERPSPITLELELSEKLPEVALDPEQIKRVFVNLIQNAGEAFETADDRSRIIVSTRFDSARDLVVAEVADNGKGIAPANLQKLFQPYFSTKGRGTGLGLAIVNRIIAEHSSRIKVTPNQPNGARFIIEIPVSG
jgi:two-component system, NtrC family, nitrogen regulation sensor histidine kinase NtrY